MKILKPIYKIWIWIWLKVRNNSFFFLDLYSTMLIQKNILKYVFIAILYFCWDLLDHTETTVSNESKHDHCLYYSIKGGETAGWWLSLVVKQPNGETAEWWVSRVVRMPLVRAPWWERRWWDVRSPFHFQPCHLKTFSET